MIWRYLVVVVLWSCIFGVAAIVWDAGGVERMESQWIGVDATGQRTGGTMPNGWRVVGFKLSDAEFVLLIAQVIGTGIAYSLAVMLLKFSNGAE